MICACFQRASSCPSIKQHFYHSNPLDWEWAIRVTNSIDDIASHCYDFILIGSILQFNSNYFNSYEFIETLKSKYVAIKHPFPLLIDKKPKCCVSCCDSAAVVCLADSESKCFVDTVIQNGERSEQAPREDVLLCLFHPDLSRGAQEEAPRSLCQLLQVLKEMLWTLEGRKHTNNMITIT